VRHLTYPLAIGTILSIRMLGLFMLLPVLPSQTHAIAGGTPFKIGLALGIYGLTQAAFQIPMGRWSDHIGRRRVVMIGLLLFIIGSLLGAFAHSMNTLILARAVQGMGAIGSTCLAWASDLTPENKRTQIMGMIGLIIGLSFALALWLGPLVFHWVGLQGIFGVTALLATASLLISSILPGSAIKQFTAPITRAALLNPQLLRLYFGIFSLHAILTALFLIIPTQLMQTLAHTPLAQSSLYLAVLFAAFITMLPVMIYAEKTKRLKGTFALGIMLLLAAQLPLLFAVPASHSIALSLYVFFTAFTLLEAMLPAFISKIAPLARKGSAMGCYSSAQFLGIFLGGSMGGLLLKHTGAAGLLIMTLTLSALWLISALTMAPPPLRSTCRITLNKDPADALSAITDIPGVIDLLYEPHAQSLLIQFDLTQISKNELRKRVEAVTL
jgi:MFS family permease